NLTHLAHAPYSCSVRPPGLRYKGSGRWLPTARGTETTAGSIVNRRLDPDARRSTRRTSRRTPKGRVPTGLFGASLCWQAAETKEAHGGADEPRKSGVSSSFKE